MKLRFSAFAVISLLATSQVFADTSDSSYFSGKGMKPPSECKSIVVACKKAGFDGSAFWFKCMKPVLLGKSVKGISVDANDIKVCKEFKIKMLKKELQEFEPSSSTQ